MKIKNLNLSQKCKDFLKNNQKVLLTRVLPIAMAGVIGVTASGISSSKVSKPKGESIGYTNVIPNFEYGIDGNDFVILDVGSYKNFKVSKLLTNYKLKYCDKKDIENGLIISTNADTEGEILKEVLYLKDIMKEYNTELPVYLNIDKIVQNSSLDNSRKRNLITSFLEKCTTNNIYVGVTGKDTNLKLMKDNLGIDDYDALVIKNNDTISYDGNYNYYVENKKIYKKNEELDLAKVIKEKDLNNKDRFRGDATYTYHKGDSLDEIALTTGLSVDDILYYNNIRHFPSLLQDFSIRNLIFDKNLSDGQKLYIPSTTAKAKSINDSEKVEYEKSEELLMGADISAYNTVSNWEDMAKQFQYLILKAGEGTTKDPKYESFASSAAQNNIPIGIYVVNTADSRLNEDDIRKQVEQEAALAIEQASYRQVDYPIYIDLEKARTEKIEDKDLKIILETWYKKIVEAGYIPGIYTSGSIATKIHNSIDESLYNEYSLWYAYGEKYSVPTSYDQVGSPSGSGLYAWNRDDVVMQQASEAGTGSAGGNGSGYIDVDYSKIDYTKPHITNKTIVTGIESESLSSTDINLASALLIGAGAIGIIRGKKKKKGYAKK